MTAHGPGESTARETAARTATAHAETARAFAPGSIGNIGPGLDILGCALTGAGDSVHARRIDDPHVVVEESGHPDIPCDPARHASAIAAAAVLHRIGERRFGVALRANKGLPLSGGQGGSAASSIAGALATNAVFGNPLTREDVLSAALVAEERIAGRHIDNLAPVLFGGILLIRSIEPLDYMRIPAPPALRVVLIHPAMRLRTADSRAVLPAMVDRTTAITQAAMVAAMVAAFYSGDLSRLRGAVTDAIAEPARAPLLPGFVAAKSAALDAGALGASISGGGPSAFALADGDDAADRVCRAMLDAYRASGVEASGRIARIDDAGARVETNVA
jgi:homoserine kinase